MPRCMDVRDRGDCEWHESGHKRVRERDSDIATGFAQVVWVPGSFELPVVAKALAKSGKFDAVIAVGTVVRLLFPWPRE